MPNTMASQEQSAKHLAARAVMAYRAGFPVGLISVISSSERPSGIVSDWKGQRDSFHNDEKLLSRAFAFVYIGSIVDQAISDPISDELRRELVSDVSSALEARQTAVDWGVAEALKDTNPYAHTGYKLASRLLRTDQPLIDSLARELTSQGTIEGDALRKWLDGNASPLDFDALEAIRTY
ncbi:MAG TPA: hypothetical protein VJP02_22150 [Candidatus Sulfotelmatobacter sp.]|nr:hypothetical protein [Candidatus Sulfotelmatobacter sp.]